MAGIGGFRGVSASQDARFVNKQERMLRTKKFPKELDLVIDYSRIVWPVIREWTAKRVTELFGIEDEVLIHFIHNRLENTQDLNPKELYLELIPFLEKNAGLFMKELWTLLASAASSSTGIPQSIMEAKAEELKQRKEHQELVRQTIEIERKKVIAIQEEAKQAIKKDEAKPDSAERRKESTLHSSEKSEKRPRHHRSKFSTLPRKSDDHHRHRRPRSRRRHDPHRHHRQVTRSIPATESFCTRTSKRDRRSMRSLSKTRSLSRSPPESRHCSPPPRTSNLPLARKRQHHDKKSRSPARLNRRGGGRDRETPTTKSPSPRSHNRMSLTPQKREKTPSPPSHHTSKTPTPKPSTPPTQQDFKNLDRGPSRFRDVEESHGASYRYDGSQVRCGYQERSPRKEYNSSRYSHHKSNRNYDRSRRGYAYRPASPPRLQSYERPRRRHRSPSSSSFDEIDKSKRLSSSDSFDSRKEGVKRRLHEKGRAKLEEKGPKRPDSDPQDSDDSLERKEKMEEKLSGILKRKDSLGLE